MSSITTSGAGTYTTTFTATATSTLVILNQGFTGAGLTTKWDNISVKEVIFDRPTDDLVLFNHPNDIPRIEYAADGSLKGLLIEEQRANLVPNSEDFSQSLFGAGGGSITSTNNPSPSGLNTATLVTATSGRVYLYTSISLSGATNKDYTASCWVKGVAEGTTARLRIGFFGGAQGGSFTTGTYENLSTTEWTRISLAGVSSESDRSSAQLVVETETENQLIVWGAQLEEGSFATSYIPTSGATVTRSPDIASILVSAFGYNEDAGTVLVEAQTVANQAATSRILSFDDGISNDDSIQIAVLSGGTSVYLEARDDVTVQVSGTSGSINSAAAPFPCSLRLRH